MHRQFFFFPSYSEDLISLAKIKLVQNCRSNQRVLLLQHICEVCGQPPPEERTSRESE